MLVNAKSVTSCNTVQYAQCNGVPAVSFKYNAMKWRVSASITMQNNVVHVNVIGCLGGHPDVCAGCTDCTATANKEFGPQLILPVLGYAIYYSI